MATISSRELNQDIGKAKRAADKGPVVITDRGKPAFVLMKYSDYQHLSSPKKTIVDMLSQDEPEADFDFEPGRLSDKMGFRIPTFDD
jgi:prevent-host-death family protein